MNSREPAPDPDCGRDALLFASPPIPSVGMRIRTILATLVRQPREAFAILQSRLAGKRVRARQATAALLGLDHRRLRLSATDERMALLMRKDRERGGRLQDIEDPPPTPTSISPQQGGEQSSRSRPGRTDTASPCVAILSAPLRPGASFGQAEIVVLTAPGHALLGDAVAWWVSAFAAGPTLQAIYGDALLLADDGSAMPLLRPAFDPDYLMAVDYVGPVVAFRRSALEAVGPLTDIAPDAPTLDLLLRIVEDFGRSAVGHLPRVLSTWGPPPAGAAAVDSRAARLASVRGHLSRTGEGATRAEIDAAGIVTVIRVLPDPAPLVSLIVPTRDRLDLLRPCIDSLLHRTDWPAREILICDNDSAEPETLAYFHELVARGAARIVACPGPFDFAGMNNAAAGVAEGRLLAFVNNDVEATEPDWLARLVREALRPDVGAVGAKLLDRQGRVQHGGVVLGPGGLVTHGHRFFASAVPGYLSGLQATRAVSAVTAACLVVEAAKFARVGGFDAETFAVDFNDVDLCLRLNAACYRTLFIGGAVLNHYEAASRRWNPQARARHLREVAAFKTRWGPLLAQDPHYHPGFDPDLGTYAGLRPGRPETGPVAPRCVTGRDAGRRSAPSRSRT